MGDYELLAEQRIEELEGKLGDIQHSIETFTQIYVNAPPASLEDAISLTLAYMKRLKGIVVG